MSVSAASVLNSYSYYYKNQYQPKLDTNSDSRWSKSELQSYADEYNKATGETLDVDKIMSTYARDDGYIHYEDWSKVRDNDALGLGKLVSLANQSDASEGASTTASTAIDLNALSDYVYATNNQLQPKLDKNYDGYWNREELQNYADAYKKASGKTLDVDSIISKYGNEDGLIGFAGQNKIKDDNALGLKELSAEYSKQAADKTNSVANEIKDNWFKKPESTDTATKDFDLSSIMDSLSAAGKTSLSAILFRTDNMSTLINNFVTANPVSDSMFGMYSAMSQRNMLGLYGSTYATQGMSNQLLDMMV